LLKKDFSIFFPSQNFFVWEKKLQFGGGEFQHFPEIIIIIIIIIIDLIITYCESWQVGVVTTNYQASKEMELSGKPMLLDHVCKLMAHSSDTYDTFIPTPKGVFFILVLFL